jgi:FkbM family methyltransferase
MQLAAIQTNGVLLVADDEDSFIRSLPLIEVRDVDALKDVVIRRGSHSHIPLFKAIIERVLCAKEFTFLDVGSYIGAISLPLAKHFAEGPVSGKFFAFEPSENALLIEQSIAINKLDNVDLIKAAASDANGSASFVSGGSNKISGRLEPGGDCEVRTVAIDSLLNFRGQSLLIKVDTEGHEPAVLRGMLNLIEENDTILVIEVHPSTLLTELQAGVNMYSYLAANFHAFNVANIGFPRRAHYVDMSGIENLVAACNRDAYMISDVMFFPKKYSIEGLVAALPEHLSLDQ